MTLTIDGNDFVLAVMDARHLCEAGLAATAIALSSPVDTQGEQHGHLADAASLDDWVERWTP